MEHHTAGDPINGLKWTRKTTLKISRELRKAGIMVSPKTVGRLLRGLKFSARVSITRRSPVNPAPFAIGNSSTSPARASASSAGADRPSASTPRRGSWSGASRTRGRPGRARQSWSRTTISGPMHSASPSREGSTTLRPIAGRYWLVPPTIRPHSQSLHFANGGPAQAADATRRPSACSFSPTVGAAMGRAHGLGSTSYRPACAIASGSRSPSATTPGHLQMEPHRASPLQ